jgi:hypothetical protein
MAQITSRRLRLAAEQARRGVKVGAAAHLEGAAARLDSQSLEIVSLRVRVRALERALRSRGLTAPDTAPTLRSAVSGG